MKNLFKKLAVSLGTAAAICLSLSPAFALGSIVANGNVVGDILVGGKVVEGASASFTNDFSYLSSSDKEEDKKAASIIEQLNAGTKLSDAFFKEDVKLPEGSKIDLKDFALLTQIQDLKAVDGNGDPLKDVTLTWEVPNLVKEAGEVYVLHYSTVRSVWEVIEPEDVNYDNKTITAHFEDLSPVGVIYKAKDSSAATDGTQTSTSTNMGLYVGIGAVALVGVGILVFKKKFN